MVVSIPVSTQRIVPQRLTTDAFRPYGYVIHHPIQLGSNHVSQQSTSRPVIVNQGTALKYPDVSQLSNQYTKSSNATSARPSISLFVSLPRQLEPCTDGNYEGILTLKIMECHPYTTQTFTPMGLRPDDEHTTYLIIVAPSCRDDVLGADVPDATNIHAFTAQGSQAVTYGVNIWHAPMVVIGREAVPFVVTQFSNGVAGDDCIECVFEGPDPGILIEVPSLGRYLPKL